MSKRSIILTVLLVLSFIVQFLPFKYEIGRFAFQNNLEVHTEIFNGFKLIFPMFSILAFALNTFLLGSVKTLASRIIALILSIFNCIYMLFILFVIEFQLFHPKKIEVGFGYPLLCLFSLGLFIVSIHAMVRPEKQAVKPTGDLLDSHF